MIRKRVKMNEIAWWVIGITVALAAIMNILTIAYIENRQKSKHDEFLDKYLIKAQEASMDKLRGSLRSVNSIEKKLESLLSMDNLEQGLQKEEG
jgi:uncharacterized protein with FMN-binding domain